MRFKQALGFFSSKDHTLSNEVQENAENPLCSVFSFQDLLLLHAFIHLFNRKTEQNIHFAKY